jgi:hypothetical protein
MTRTPAIDLVASTAAATYQDFFRSK